MKNIQIEIGGEMYTLRKVENKLGSMLRLEVFKEGQDKPYVVTYNSNAYGDSVHPGWSCGCKGWIMKRGALRKCKHLEGIAQEMSKLATHAA